MGSDLTELVAEDAVLLLLEVETDVTTASLVEALEVVGEGAWVVLLVDVGAGAGVELEVVVGVARVEVVRVVVVGVEPPPLPNSHEP